MCNTCGKPIFRQCVGQRRNIAEQWLKCFEDEEAAIDTLIAYIMFDQIRGTFMSTDGDQVTEMNASVILFSLKPDPRQAVNIPSNHRTTLMVFPDNCATICLRGPKYLLNMGLTKDHLVPSRKNIQIVGFPLLYQGWLPVEFVVRGKTTKQVLYICKDIQWLYFSWATCIDVWILHENFSNPLANKQSKELGPKPNKCEDQLPTPQTLLFLQQKKTLANLRAGSWKIW